MDKKPLTDLKFRKYQSPCCYVSENDLLFIELGLIDLKISSKPILDLALSLGQIKFSNLTSNYYDQLIKLN